MQYYRDCEVCNGDGVTGDTPAHEQMKNKECTACKGEGKIRVHFPKDLPLLDLKQLRALSVERAIKGFNCYHNQLITYWTTAVAGELGELCNMIKKLQRVAAGGLDGGNSYTAKDITPAKLKEEIGGIFIYLDLLASLLNISTEEAIIETFNAKSLENNWLWWLLSTK